MSAHEAGSAARLDLFVAPAAGADASAWTRIVPDHDWPDKPRWAPDGRTLFFLSRKPTSYFNVWAIRFDPDRGQPVGDAMALTNFDSPRMSVSPYVNVNDLGISATRAALPMLTVTGSIWMLDNVDK